MTTTLRNIVIRRRTRSGDSNSSSTCSCCTDPWYNNEQQQQHPLPSPSSSSSTLHKVQQQRLASSSSSLRRFLPHHRPIKLVLFLLLLCCWYDAIPAAVVAAFSIKRITTAAPTTAASAAAATRRQHSFLLRQYYSKPATTLLEKLEDSIVVPPKVVVIEEGHGVIVVVEKNHQHNGKQEMVLPLDATDAIASALPDNEDDVVGDGVGIDGNMVEDIDGVEHTHHDHQKNKNTNILSSLMFGNDDDGSHQKELYFARFLLLAAASLYGTNFSVVKILGQLDIPIGISATLRFGLAAIATSPWLLPSSSSNKSTIDNNADVAVVVAKDGKERSNILDLLSSWTEEERGATKAGFIAGMWNCIAYIAQAVGLTTTLASKSAFLCSLAVVIVPLLDRMTGKQLISRQIIGIVLALTGVAFLELGGISSSDLLTFTSGDIASLLQPLAFGMAFWKMEHACADYPEQATRLTASQLLAVFLGSLSFTIITDPSALLSNANMILSYLSNPMIVGSLLWTGFVTTALTIYMETMALKTVSAADATLILSTEPLWGSIFAAILMGETFGYDSIVGGILVLSGCIYSSLGYRGITEFFTNNQKDQKNLPQQQE